MTAATAIRQVRDKAVRIVVWDERQPKQKSMYEDFLGNHIADYLRKQKGFKVRSVGLDDPQQGLSEEILNNCDVLIWWEDGRWVLRNKSKGPFGHVTHIMGAGGRIAALFWQRYQFTMDETWLRDRAYGAFVYGGEGGIEPLPPEEDLKSRFLGFNRLNSFIDTAGIGGAQIFRNRLRLREGPGAIDAEHIGGLASGIHETMLSSSPEEVDGEPVLSIFNDWPKSWDAAFTLLARGAFVVSSSMEKGRIEFVQIRSEAGGQCHLRNPWPDKTVTLYRNGKKAEDLSGSVLKFPTAPGETVTAVLQGTKPSRKESERIRILK